MLLLLIILVKRGIVNVASINMEAFDVLSIYNLNKEKKKRKIAKIAEILMSF